MLSSVKSIYNSIKDIGHGIASIDFTSDVEKRVIRAMYRDSKRRNIPLDKHYLLATAHYGWLDITHEILHKMDSDVSIDHINVRNADQHTPLHIAAMFGYLDIIEALWAKMGPAANSDDLNPKDDSKQTPLHLAVIHEHYNVVLAILNKLVIKANLSEIDLRDSFGHTPLHYAAQIDNPIYLKAIWSKMGTESTIDDINPKDKSKKTPLHVAVQCCKISIIRAIFERIGPDASMEDINPRCRNGKTPLYSALENQDYSIVYELLDNKLVEVNNIGPHSLFTFVSANYGNHKWVKDRLRQLGCLEIPGANQGSNARLVQDSQGIHASGVEKSIACSLENLRTGAYPYLVSNSYNQFIQYCNPSNQAFLDDLQAIEVNSQNFSRYLIVKALSVADADLENKKTDVEQLKRSLFSKAILHQISNMVRTSNSIDFVESFKERIGLIWWHLNNPDSWHKFTDLKEIIDKEGEAFLKDNPSAEFKSALQKLRNVLFIQLVETRYEYAAGINTNSQTPSRAQFLDALERSRPSCAGGTNNFIIECFSHRHQDIEVLAGQFTPDFTPDATLPIRIASKLYELILASVNTRSEVQTRVDSEIKIHSIEGISIFNEILDRMAGASDEVKKVLPQDTILLEDRIREYFRTGSIPGHSRAIGTLLGLLKQTLQKNLDIIGGLTLQAGQNQAEALTEAFRHLEQALANSQPGFLTQALTEARSQYYQSFFKANLNAMKLNFLANICLEIDGVGSEEIVHLKAALIEYHGEYVEDAQVKVVSNLILNRIKESIWYHQLLNECKKMMHDNNSYLTIGYKFFRNLVSRSKSIPSNNNIDDLVKRIDKVFGIEAGVLKLNKSNHHNTIDERDDINFDPLMYIAPAVVLLSGSNPLVENIPESVVSDNQKKRRLEL